MDYQYVRAQAVEYMIGRGWKEKGAKRGRFEQSLFDHSLIELDVLIALLPLLRETFTPSLAEQEEQVLIASVVAHDVGKELDEWQKYLQGQRRFISDVNRELAEQILPELVELFGFTGIEEMLSNVLLHMHHERTPAKVMERVLFGGHTNERWKTLADLVDEVDNLCSIRGPLNAIEYLAHQSRFSSHIRVAYHLVQIRGVSTTLLHRAAIDSFIARGWSPLLHYSSGTIYALTATKNVTEPLTREIEARLAVEIEAALPKNLAPLIVGSPLETMMPKADLFDYRDLHDCLQEAARRVNRFSFGRKSETARRKTVGDYLELKGDSMPMTNETLDRESERIGTAQPEICIFKFFKAALANELLGSEVVPEAEKAYADFSEGGGKKKTARVTPQSVARAEYDRVFGEGAYADLQSTSTLMPARDMKLTVDRFWSLDGMQFGLDVARIEYLVPSRREYILIDTLVSIANKVYAAVPELNRPIRATPKQIAKCFIADLVHPAEQLNLAVLVNQQMKAYSETKANARRTKGAHLCPICNMTFEGGTEAKADFVEFPDAHTNRATSHGGGGKIVICDACKFERFLQQLMLGSKVSNVLVVLPRMNIGHSSGETMRQKAIQIWDTALARMSEASSNPDQHISLGMTHNMARKLSDVFRLSPTDIVELMTYQSREETAKNDRRDLENRLKELYGVNQLTVDVLNDNWSTNYVNVPEAIKELIENKVSDDDARKTRAAAFRLDPQLYVACQTPHMILVPLTNPVSMRDDSDTNAGIRELYISLLLGLALDCSVAVVDAMEAITFEGGEGVARVPPVPALRQMIGVEWVGIDAAKQWLHAIGAAAQLADETAFPERSNLYAILKSPTAGHILRRIEQKSNSGHAYIRHIQLLGTIQEVLR